MSTGVWWKKCCCAGCSFFSCKCGLCVWNKEHPIIFFSVKLLCPVRPFHPSIIWRENNPHISAVSENFCKKFLNNNFKNSTKQRTQMKKNTTNVKKHKNSKIDGWDKAKIFKKMDCHVFVNCHVLPCIFAVV